MLKSSLTSKSLDGFFFLNLSLFFHKCDFYFMNDSCLVSGEYVIIAAVVIKVVRKQLQVVVLSSHFITINKQTHTRLYFSLLKSNDSCLYSCLATLSTKGMWGNVINPHQLLSSLFYCLMLLSHIQPTTHHTLTLLCNFIWGRFINSIHSPTTHTNFQLYARNMTQVFAQILSKPHSSAIF